MIYFFKKKTSFFLRFTFLLFYMYEHFACMYICAPHACLLHKDLVSLHVVLGLKPRPFTTQVLLTIKPTLQPSKWILKTHHPSHDRLLYLWQPPHFSETFWKKYSCLLSLVPPLFLSFSLFGFNHHYFPFVKPGWFFLSIPLSDSAIKT